VKSLDGVLLPPTATIHAAVVSLESGSAKIVLVVDELMHLLGTVTDGDIRRGILRGVSFGSPVTAVMNSSPQYAHRRKRHDELARIMREDGVRHLPLLDDDQIVVGLETLVGTEPNASKDNWVVLMAGGVGRRLAPLTNDRPKPLVKVGNKPVLETIIDSFVEHGFHKFFMSVNYKADMLKSHFGDGSAWGAEFKYLHEVEPLGTAGSLSLLPHPRTAPILVMNTDILTRVNFEHLVEFHIDSGVAATMCVREYDLEVPFGVVDVDSYRINGIVEKPLHSFFVNAGIYVFEPRALNRIPEGAHFDMPELFESLIGDQNEIAAFPIREYWIDIGHKENLTKAESDYSGAFS
jgi:dTDP-glucose pyrophosphorylase